jgi:hypothetical protein
MSITAFRFKQVDQFCQKYYRRSKNYKNNVTYVQTYIFKHSIVYVLWVRVDNWHGLYNIKYAIFCRHSLKDTLISCYTIKNQGLSIFFRQGPQTTNLDALEAHINLPELLFRNTTVCLNAFMRWRKITYNLSMTCTMY